MQTFKKFLMFLGGTGIVTLVMKILFSLKKTQPTEENPPRRHNNGYRPPIRQPEKIEPIQKQKEKNNETLAKDNADNLNRLYNELLGTGDVDGEDIDS